MKGQLGSLRERNGRGEEMYTQKWVQGVLSMADLSIKSYRLKDYRLLGDSEK